MQSRQLPTMTAFSFSKLDFDNFCQILHQRVPPAWHAGSEQRQITAEGDASAASWVRRSAVLCIDLHGSRKKLRTALPAGGGGYARIRFCAGLAATVGSVGESARSKPRLKLKASFTHSSFNIDTQPNSGAHTPNKGIHSPGRSSSVVSPALWSRTSA